MNVYAQDVPIVRLRHGHRPVLAKKPAYMPSVIATPAKRAPNTAARRGITAVLVPVLQPYAPAVRRRVVFMAPVPQAVPR